MYLYGIIKRIVACRNSKCETDLGLYDPHAQTRPVTSFSFSPDCGRWHVVEAYSSCLLNETIAAQAWADFVVSLTEKMGMTLSDKTTSAIDGDVDAGWVDEEEEEAPASPDAKPEPSTRLIFGRGYANYRLEEHLRVDFTAGPDPIPRGIEEWWKEVTVVQESIRDTEPTLKDLVFGTAGIEGGIVPTPRAELDVSDGELNELVVDLVAR